MRADALAKRAAIVAAAERMVPEFGLEMPYSQLAVEAGVGVATVHRHFPAREDLIMGLAQLISGRVLDLVTRWLPRFEEDPERAWEGFVRGLAELKLGSVLPSLMVGRRFHDLPESLHQARTAGLAAVEQVLAQARRYGLIHPDVSALDFQLAISRLTRPLPVRDIPGEAEREDWLIGVLLRGLRP